MSNATIRDDIPLGYTCDKRGNVLSFRDIYGDWRKYTRDEQGNVLSYEDYSGYWYKCSYNERGNELSFRCIDGRWREQAYDTLNNELTYKDNNGHWRKFTRDEQGNELSYKDKDGVWLTLANSGHTLRYLNGIYWAGCHKFTRDKALAHWGKRLNHECADTSARAECFIEAINNHKPDDLQVKD
jgi:YD repeat-containing protein